MAECTDKHTPVDVPDEDFNCPKCGAEAGDFIVTDGISDCVRLHPSEVLGCDKCGHGVTARSFVRAYMKRKNLTRCEHCKGSGYVQGVARG